MSLTILFRLMDRLFHSWELESCFSVSVFFAISLRSSMMSGK